MIDRRTIVRSVVGLPFMAASTGCGVLSPRGTMRFRMTVEAGEPGDVRIGSGVLRVVASHSWVGFLPEAHAATVVVTGEAVVLNLRSGPIFALRRRPLDTDLGTPVVTALDPSAPRPGTSELTDVFIERTSNLGHHRGRPLRAALARDQWPLMVRFSDVRDPTSVMVVDPEAVGVRSVVVETTTDEVTEGLDRLLHWLPSYQASVSITVNRINRLNLYAHDFSTEI